MSHDTGRGCVCMAEHRPAPLELERHHIWPTGMGGPDVDSNIAWVCPTTHTNCHEMLRAMVRDQTIVAYSTFAEVYIPPVSRYAYNLAVDGFRRWQAGAA